MKEGFGKFLVLVGWALVILSVGAAYYISGFDIRELIK
jgi:hypothetical protein